MRPEVHRDERHRPDEVRPAPCAPAWPAMSYIVMGPLDARERDAPLGEAQEAHADELDDAARLLEAPSERVGERVRVRDQPVGRVRQPVVGAKDVSLVVLAELVVPLLLAELEEAAHRGAVARPLRARAACRRRRRARPPSCVQSFCGAPSSVVIAVARPEPGAPLARRLRHEGHVHVRALDARALEHVRCARVSVRGRRGPRRARRRRELRDARLEHGELAEAPERVRHVDGAQVAEDDLVAAVLAPARRRGRRSARCAAR